MVLSICEWGIGKPWLWGAETGNLWRTTQDILPCRTCRKSWWGLGWQRILDQQVGLGSYSRPGHWNDPDMLVVGVKDLSEQDGRAHFSFWSLLAAPLIAGNDPRSMSQATKAILTNKEVIAVNQDPLGLQGRRVRKRGGTEIWVKELVGGARSLVLFNRSDSARTIQIVAEDVSPLGLRYGMRDLWKKQDLGEFSGKYRITVAAHDVVMLRMTPVAGLP
jgi:alpha-galactosidase